MKYLINTSSLTGPTADTVRFEVGKRFKKLLRLIENTNKAGENVKITVIHDSNEFLVNVEANYFGTISLSVKHYSLRKAITLASIKLKQIIVRKKTKVIDTSRRYSNVDKISYIKEYE